jgi:hypothetical protein
MSVLERGGEAHTTHDFHMPLYPQWTSLVSQTFHSVYAHPTHADHHSMPQIHRLDCLSLGRGRELQQSIHRLSRFSFKKPIFA